MKLFTLREVANRYQWTETKLRSLIERAQSPFVFYHRERFRDEPKGPGDKSWQRIKRTLGITKKRTIWLTTRS